MNKQVLAGSLIGLGATMALLLGVVLGMGIPLGSLGGKINNQLFQSTRYKASSNQTTAQSPASNGTPTPSNSGKDNSAPVTALW